MPCGYRGMGGKDRGPGDDFKSGFKVNVMAGYGLSQPLQAGKGRMSFVHMQNLDIDFHGRQRTHPADSQ